MTASASLMDQAGVLVQRARAGDRNAKVQLARIGEGARAGSPQARASFQAVKEYINGESMSAGAEPSQAIVTIRTASSTPTINKKQWLGIMGGGALLGGLICGLKGAALLGFGVPVVTGALIYSTLRSAR